MFCLCQCLLFIPPVIKWILIREPVSWFRPVCICTGCHLNSAQKRSKTEIASCFPCFAQCKMGKVLKNCSLKESKQQGCIMNVRIIMRPRLTGFVPSLLFQTWMEMQTFSRLLRTIAVVQPVLMSPRKAVSDISSGRDTLTAVTVKWNGFPWEAERLFVSQTKQAESKEEINTDISRLLTAPLIYYWCLGPSGLNLGCAKTLDLDQWAQGRWSNGKIKEFQKKCEYELCKTRQTELGFTGAFRVIHDTGS